MNLRKVGLLVAGIMLSAAVSSFGAEPIILDGSFEVPSITSNTFQYNPVGGPWTFTSQSGIISCPNDLPGFAPPAPVDGTQIAFLQYFYGAPGSFSQSVLFPEAGDYVLSFYEAGRDDTFNPVGLPYEILLDTNVIGSTTALTSEPFTLRTFDFSATSGGHTLTFSTAATATTDHTAFFDSLSVQSVPEPGVGAFLLFGATLLLGSRNRRAA